jgi:hypothetical protein
MFSDLIKARQHKYIKRVPKAGGGYTYFYREQHGGGVALKEHMKAGAAFRLTHNGQEGHFHIKELDGERLTVEHDETRVKVEMTRDELAALLTRQHRQALQADADKKRARAEKLKRDTPDYIGNKRAERLAAEAEARLKVGEERTANPTPPQKPATPQPFTLNQARQALSELKKRIMENLTREGTRPTEADTAELTRLNQVVDILEKEKAKEAPAVQLVTYKTGATSHHNKSDAIIVDGFVVGEIEYAYGRDGAGEPWEVYEYAVKLPLLNMYYADNGKRFRHLKDAQEHAKRAVAETLQDKEKPATAHTTPPDYTPEGTNPDLSTPTLTGASAAQYLRREARGTEQKIKPLKYKMHPALNADFTKKPQSMANRVKSALSMANIYDDPKYPRPAEATEADAELLDELAVTISELENAVLKNMEIDPRALRAINSVKTWTKVLRSEQKFTRDTHFRTPLLQYEERKRARWLITKDLEILKPLLDTIERMSTGEER